jgi:sulfate adenylyltransferase subunit 1 (EFTu-like GTPase family)
LILQCRRKFQAVLSELQAVYDVTALETKSSASLAQNEVGVASMTASVPMVSSSFTKNRLLGSFVVVDPASKNSVAGGIVL